MRRWPSSIRCRVAARPPFQLSDRRVGRDVGGRLAVGVDDDERDRAARQHALLRRRELRRDEEHAHRGTGERGLEPGARGSVLAQLGQDDARARRRGDLLHTADDLERPGRAQTVEREVDEPGARGGGRGPAAAVAVPGQRLLDALPSSGRDVGAAVEHLGHGRDRDADLACDVGDGRRPGTAGLGRLQGHPWSPEKVLAPSNSARDVATFDTTVPQAESCFDRGAHVFTRTAAESRGDAGRLILGVRRP
jgi:hypothetical protein